MKFNDLLVECDNGLADQQASELLAQLIDAIETHGGSGHVTVKLAVKGDGKSRAAVKASTTHSIPREKIATSIFHFNKGALSRANPLQTNLDIKTVSAPSAPKELTDE